MTETKVDSQSLKILKRNLLVVSLVAILFFSSTAALLFKLIDNSMHIDDLYVGVATRKQEMHFLASVSSIGLTDCKLSVEAFERIAKQNNQVVNWSGNDGLAGALHSIQVKRRGDCIEAFAVPL